MAESKRKGETALDRKLKRLKREVPSTDLDTNKEDASSAVDESSTNPQTEVTPNCLALRILFRLNILFL